MWNYKGAAYVDMEISAYGKLVLTGVHTMDESEAGKKLVPEPYQEAVAEWLAEREEKRSRAWN